MKFIQAYQNLMRGRYGRFDFLNRVLIVLALILWLISAFNSMSLLRLIVILIVIYVLYRFFSKRIYVRLNENKKVQERLHALDTKLFKRRQKQSTVTQLYFECPNCHQKLRAPKGKGKIKVTCAKCGHIFIKKV